MKQHSKHGHDAVPYNESVETAYFTILKQTKGMLACIEQKELRFTLERQDKGQPVVGSIIHELVNPLLYLRLECHQDNQYAIHWGIEELTQQGELSDLTTRFLRLLYKVTMNGAYPVDIENCIRTDWFLKNSCSEMYEYIEERNKHHTFKQIKYKVTASKRKQILSVA